MPTAAAGPSKDKIDTATSTGTAERAARVERICRLIEHSDTPPTLKELAGQEGISPHHLHRIFRAETGLTPKAYANGHRAQRLRQQLILSESSITDAIYNAGFNATSRFYENSEKLLGMRTRQYRAGGEGAIIRFAVGQCSLGAILVAQSQRGVCAISLGDDADVLTKNLQDSFPRAELVGADPVFENLVAQVVGFIEQPARGLKLPLDVRGTAFQQRVWQALCDIPAGATLSYTELAERIGYPGAVRAVAGACAANPIAVAIPCHRVVRRDGGLAGYRWGIERKRELLRRESEIFLGGQTV